MDFFYIYLPSHLSRPCKLKTSATFYIKEFLILALPLLMDSENTHWVWQREILGDCLYVPLSKGMKLNVEMREESKTRDQGLCAGRS